MSDEFEKLGFGETEIDFDMHFGEGDYFVIRKLNDRIKSVEVDGQETEFGIEMLGDDIHISFGFGGIKVDSDVFFKEFGKMLLREQRIKELKREG